MPVEFWMAGNGMSFQPLKDSEMNGTCDLNSNLADLANALTACQAHIKALEAQLRQEEERHRRLSVIIGKRLTAIFPGSGAPDFDGIAILNKIEGDVKRSATRVVRDEKKRASKPEAARIAAEISALAVAERNGLTALTDTMLRHIEHVVAKEYGQKRRLTVRA